MDNRVPAGVGAETFERPSECHTRQPILKTNPTTGMKYWDMPARRPLCEIILKHDVPGLRAFALSNVSIALEWVSMDPIDEADAIDAQCRAGWEDLAFGFFEFKTMRLENGPHVAVWKCWRSSE